MSDNSIDGLAESLKEGNLDKVRDIVDNLVWDLIRKIRDGAGNVTPALQLMKYVVNNAKVLLGEAENSVEYQVGLLEGARFACSKLYEHDQERELVEELLSKHRMRAAQILAYLRDNDHGFGIQHTDLANALGLSSSNLSNHMKYLLEAAAVQAQRSGKNRRYSLTNNGKQYVDKFDKQMKQEKESVGGEAALPMPASRKDITDRFLAAATELMNCYPLTVRVEHKGEPAALFQECDAALQVKYYLDVIKIVSDADGNIVKKGFGFFSDFENKESFGAVHGSTQVLAQDLYRASFDNVAQNPLPAYARETYDSITLAS